MPHQDWLARRFESNRARLRQVAYRMLGSLSEADDAVQEAWVRLARAETDDVENLPGWLTTVVSRVCLDILRARAARREEPFEAYVPDPVLSRAAGAEAEDAAILAESVGLALLVVLETLPPAERIAFVLHDVFAVPFEEIAPIVERSPAAARQLASRARRRVQGAARAPDADPARRQAVVDAFLAASRAGNFEALLGLLDPDVVLRLDRGESSASRAVRGAAGVAEMGFKFSGPGWVASPVLVNGAPGLVITREQRPMSVVAFTVLGGKIAAIDILADPARLRTLDFTALEA